MALRDPRTQLAIIDATIMTHTAALRGLKELLFTNTGICAIHYVSVVDKVTHRGAIQDRVCVVTANAFMLCDSKNAVRCFPMLDIKEVLVFLDGFLVLRNPSEHDLAMRLRDGRETEYLLNVISVIYYFQQQDRGIEPAVTLRIVRLAEVFDHKKHTQSLGLNFVKGPNYFTKVISIPVMPWNEVTRQQLAGGAAVRNVGTDSGSDHAVLPLSNRGTQSGPSLANPETNGGPPIMDLLDHPLLRPSAASAPAKVVAPKTGSIVASCYSNLDGIRQKQEELYREQQGHMRALQEFVDAGAPPKAPPPTRPIENTLLFVVPPPRDDAPGVSSPIPVASFKGTTKSMIVVPSGNGNNKISGGVGSIPRPLSFDTPVSGIMSSAASNAVPVGQSEDRGKKMIMCIQDEVVSLRQELHEAVDSMRQENILLLSKDMEIKALREEMVRMKKQPIYPPQQQQQQAVIYDPISPPPRDPFTPSMSVPIGSYTVAAAPPPPVVAAAAAPNPEVSHLPAKQRLEIRKRQLEEKRALIDRVVYGDAYDAAKADELQSELIALIRVMEADVKEISNAAVASDDSDVDRQPPGPPAGTDQSAYAGWYDYCAQRRANPTNIGTARTHTPTRGTPRTPMATPTTGHRAITAAQLFSSPGKRLPFR